MDAPRRPAARTFLLSAAALAVLVLAAHGASLWDGLFFDDHWHRVTVRELGWSFPGLVESATFDLPGRLTHLWWQQQPLQWRYARPVAMLFMKLEWLLAGNSAFIVHACALAWHWATAVLVYALAARVLRRPGVALLAAAIFVINPHSVFAVSWIAARNALVGGFFFVAAMLAYARTLPASTDPSAATTPPHRFTWSLFAALALWLFALFSRETGIIFPLIALALDLSLAGRRYVLRRWPVYLLLATLTAAYLYWRLLVFPTRGIPDIYFTAPHGPEYLLWAGAKLLQMLFAQVFYTPLFLGLATYGGSATAAWLTYAVMAVLLALVTWWYVVASRGTPARWLWPLWVVAAFVPVIPVFIMPHFSYLPAAAYAVFAALLLARIRGRWRYLVGTLVIGGMLWSHFVYRTVWRGVLRAEQLIYADIRSTTPTAPGSKVFFINLPIAGIYAPVALRDLWHRPDVEGYVLTFAPHPLMMTSPSSVEVLNDHEFLVTAPTPGYFSGLSGRMLLDGMRPGHPLTPGLVVAGPEFNTTVVAADARGVTQLRFTFPHPLASSDYSFYVSSPQRPAYRLRFERESVGALALSGTAAEDDAWRVTHAADLAARDWYFRIVDLAGRAVRSEVLLTDTTP
jgi:hypothetical protein